ncbi:tetratricopeptide repeat protein [Jannaschia rubra]|uniref:Putative PEP-CTERM system TPR-repeat lipoprotein n=1 Tax=Jannaschia rubra TaxID=282197 RepID=A0A0M6XQT5_9RHOB|nr:tetratricopeptide repeat protein [Jannaschia rubra]CTQ32374.1 putative PEP-CTERM system TPR-repeat lipoprotein [Jannaschia rubra]SFG45912.1 TPR repeat-containing protein [Jannaschia rubra]
MVDLRVTLKALVLAIACGYATSLPAQELEADPDALLNRLGTLTAENDEAEARRLANEVLERWTHSGSVTLDLLLRRGMEAIADGDYPRAIAHLTALTDHAPDFAEGWNQRATAFFLSDRYGEAVSDIEQVLILEPRHFGALAGLGIILEQLGEEESALRAYEAAQQVHPAEPNVNSAIERLQQQTGERTL